MATAQTALPDFIPRIITNLDQVLVGKRRVIRTLLTGLLAGGHVLVEDVPGVGKTVLARGLARSISAAFRRIQFTPDLMPSDVVGVSIFDTEQRKFAFRPGPIFTNVLLADEINRATPKTQACLLESMAEEQVTVDGQTFKLHSPFFVIATQNPIEQHGCYPLPEAQLDRFLVKLRIGYPDSNQERKILEDQTTAHPLDALRPVCTKEMLVGSMAAVRTVAVSPVLLDYIVRIVASTREHADVHVGASPRGSLGLRRAAQAVALLAERDFVIPDDIKQVVVPVLGHRLILKHHAIVEGRTSETVLRSILTSIPLEE